MSLGTLIATKGLRASRGRTLLLFASLTISAALVSGTVLAIFAAQSARARDDVVNARHAVFGNSSEPHTRWHVDHILLTPNRSITNIDVAGKGAAAPLPPGLDRFPAPGTVLVSPSLRSLIARGDFTPPGRVAGTLPDRYMELEDSLVMMTGWKFETLVAHVQDSHPIVSFSGGTGLDGNDLSAIGFILAVVAGTIYTVVLGIPMCAFVAAAARVGAQRRAERLAALRLVGMSASGVRRAAAIEAAMVGAAAGVAGPIVVALLGLVLVNWPARDIVAGLTFVVPIMAVLVALISAIVAYVGLRRVDISPLGVTTKAPRRRVRGALLVIGWSFAGLLIASAVSQHQNLSAAAGLVLVVAFAAAAFRRPITRRVGRFFSARVRRPSLLLAARRMAQTPDAAARGLGLLAVVFFAVGAIAVGSQQPAHGDPADTRPAATQHPDLTVTSQVSDSESSVLGVLPSEAPLGARDLDEAAREIGALAGTRVESLIHAGSGVENPAYRVGPTPRGVDIVLGPSARGGSSMTYFKQPGGTEVDLRATTVDNAEFRALAAEGVSGVINPAAARKLNAGTDELFVYTPDANRRAIAEIVARRPSLEVRPPDSSTSVVAFWIVLGLILFVPLASIVAISAADRSYARRGSIATSWAIGVGRSTLRSAALIESLIPLLFVTVTATAAGVSFGWLLRDGEPVPGAAWAAVAISVGVGAAVWLVATAVIAPIVSRAAAARTLRTA